MIVVFTAVCQEDAVWIPQYLAEMERLDLPFAMHMDRCDEATKQLVKSHRLCVGQTYNKDDSEFNEQHKQEVMGLVRRMGKWQWAMAVDIDETFEDLAKVKLTHFVENKHKEHLVTVRWANLWETPDNIRVDGPFKLSRRVKLYNLEHPWVFDHPITNGAKHQSDGEASILNTNIMCLHWGMMTRELRAQHKARWDRIYTAAVGANPYGFWNYACDEGITPQIIPNVWSTP